jgi:ribonuclease Z
MFATPLARQPVRQYTRWHFNDGSGFTLTGYSRSTDRTGFHIRELGVGLDVGTTRGRRPPAVFVTHCHKDHVNDVAWVARRPGARIYVPAERVDAVRAFIKADAELDTCEPTEYHLHGVRAGDVLVCDGQLSQWSVRVFHCTHAVPCVGYAFDRTSHTLAPQYVGLPGADLQALRKGGVCVTQPVSRPRFAYVGDTSIRVFADNPWLLSYPIVIVECTFLTAEHDDRCARDGHISWPQLQPFVAAHPATTFVLIHFSLRYSAASVREFFAQHAADLPNVVVNINGHDAGE